MGEEFEKPGEKTRWAFQMRFNHVAASVTCRAGIDHGKLQVQVDAVKE